MANKNGSKSTVETVAAVADAVSFQDHLIHLSSGVVLRAKQAPPLALVMVMAAFPRPKPPTWKNPQMGREMPNPDDPDYIDQLRAHQTESSNALLNALIIYGTELVEVPKKFPKPEDNDWLEEYSILGLQTHPESRSWRYLTWIMVKAVMHENDLIAIRDEVGRLSGVSEDSVRSAEAFSGRDQNS